MRRSLAFALACLLCLAVVVPVAAHGRPEKNRLDPTVVTAEDLAGTCDFPVEVVDTFASANEFIFPAEANGDQLLKYNGGYKSTFTNLDTGASIDIKYFGNVKYLIRASGVVDIQSAGSVLYWVTAEETVSIFEPGIYIITGSLQAQIDGATGLNTQPEQFKGRIVDLCAAID